MAKDPLAPRNLKLAQCCPTVMLETDSLSGARPWPHVYNAPASFMLHLALLGGGSRLLSSCREGGQHCPGGHRVQILLQAIDSKGRACPCSSPLLCCLILLTDRKSIVRSKGTAGRGSQGLQQFGHLPWLVPLGPNVE